MEDKELQELFDAKRTVEANRRRQEALAKMIDHLAAQEAKPKIRRLWWPVWAGAAAAVVALLLITLPTLFSSENTLSTVVAETEVPEVVLPQEAPEETPETRLPRKPKTPREPSSSEAAPAAQPLEKEVPETAPTLPESTIEEPATILEDKVLETVAPTPRVMRRQSTLIACTEGCSVPEGNSETPSNSNVKVNFFSNENYADATIHTFVINK